MALYRCDAGVCRQFSISSSLSAEHTHTLPSSHTNNIFLRFPYFFILVCWLASSELWGMYFLCSTNYYVFLIFHCFIKSHFSVYTWLFVSFCFSWINGVLLTFKSLSLLRTHLTYFKCHTHRRTIYANCRNDAALWDEGKSHCHFQCEPKKSVKLF